MVKWNILDTGVHTAEENMAIDQALLEELDPSTSPLLHFYDWQQESATFGYFVDPSRYLNLEEAKRRGLCLARRPTGGGIVFHIWDLAFSVLVPAGHPFFSENTLENYAFVNRRVLSAVSAFLSQGAARSMPLEMIRSDLAAPDTSSQRFCMAQPTKYDVVVQGMKVAGAAQRKTKKGFLHQGTIALKVPPTDYLAAVLLPKTRVLEAMMARTFPLIDANDSIADARWILKELLKKHFEEHEDETTSQHTHSHHTHAQ